MTKRTPGCKSTNDWRHIVFGAVLVPVILAVANHLTVSYAATFGSLRESFAYAISLVVQLAVIACVLSVLNLPLWIKTAIYVWCLGLINLHVIVMALDSTAGTGWQARRGMPAAALLSGEICLLWACGILGTGPAMIRIPVCAIPAWGLWWTWKYCSSHRSAWNQPITLQVGALITFCIVLRVVGFRLSRIDLHDSKEQQFGLRHMLVATTLLALIFSMGRGGAPLVGDAFSSIRDWKILLATTTAFCLVVAVWTALGKERIITRLLFYIILVGTVGGLHWNASIAFLALPRPGAVDYERYRLATLEAWWIGWFFISSATLISILTYVRLSGHVFTRSKGFSLWSALR